MQSSLQCVGDIEWLQRALGQLVENAIEASPPKGAVTISCQEAPDASILTIEDTGAGIPSEVRPVLFDRLRAAGGIDERKTGGLGLGLFIAKSVIQAHGGVIDVEGAAGGGTRMTVHILRKPEASPSHAQVH
ncbi:MAG: sensor histidine kinase [Candidatus Omnitrophica bacterium]|nr:sensor histidine kinase [Candidatus Omnitrophota bacterium]